MAEAPGVGGVKEYDVEVAGQPAVLEPVVENEHLALALLDSSGGEGDAIRPLEVRHVGEVLFQDERLVVAAAVGSVAAAEDGDEGVALAVEARDVLDEGGLTGAADAE